MTIKQRVAKFIEENYDEQKALFDASTISSDYKLMGVKTQTIANFAKTLAKEGVQFKDLPKRNHEEILLSGMYISLCDASPEEKTALIREYLPYIDNWATCDLVVPRLTGMESQQAFFEELLASQKPYDVRFAIVWFKKFVLKKDVRGTVNLLNKTVKCTDYYVEMALAWIYCEALLLDYDYMLKWVSKLSRYVIRNRTLSKACDSYRTTPEQKKEIRQLRSKLLSLDISNFKMG